VIIKIHSSGRSFKSLANYLIHDPKAQTAERVAWTYTLNCAHDEVLSAVNEMYTVCMAAEYLKEEAGVRPGGRKLEKPVKHISLSWQPGQEPTREQMIEAVESFLQHMKWDECQALLVGHDDKEHRHVHVMLNAVHPETGLKINEGNERWRARDWGLAYEREQGEVLCKQREKDPSEREPSPDRNSWLKLKESQRQHEEAENKRRSYDPAYLARDGNSIVIEGQEWKLLKAHQRQEREAFFAEGKTVFTDLRKEIYREVREEFREEWGSYYAAKREGLDGDRLAAMREDILERQNAMLDERRNEACTALRERRDGEYDALKSAHQEARDQLRDRQGRGLSSPQLLDLLGRPAPEVDARAPDASNHDRGFQAAGEIGEQSALVSGDSRDRAAEEESFGITAAENPRVRDGADVVGDLGMGMIGALATIGERFFDGFLGGTAPRGPAQQPERSAPEPRSESAREQSLARATETAQRNAEQQQDQDRRNRTYWEERDRERER
jgi:hypothetical protein